MSHDQFGLGLGLGLELVLGVLWVMSASILGGVRVSIGRDSFGSGQYRSGFVRYQLWSNLTVTLTLTLTLTLIRSISVVVQNKRNGSCWSVACRLRFMSVSIV